MRIRTIITALLTFLLSSSVAFAQNDFTHRQDVQTFIQKMVKKYDFKKAYLTGLFEQVRFPKPVIHKMNAPAEAKPWYIYKKIFITPEKINEGVNFWRAHQEALNRAQKIYGVPASIIVATMGIESRYGKNKGKFKVLDTLTNLAFNYPKRSRYFKYELEQYLLLTREMKLDPRNMTGSYAGAIGLPQFMPSSYRHYAVNFSGKQAIDLVNDEVDVIGSIANYYKRHGWRTGEPIANLPQLSGDKYLKIIKKSKKPRLTLKELESYGVRATQTFKPTEKAGLAPFRIKDKTQYWLIFHNFYVIMRYNTSSLYAMAVYELSQELQEAMNKNSAKKENFHT